MTTKKEELKTIVEELNNIEQEMIRYLNDDRSVSLIDLQSWALTLRSIVRRNKYQ